MKLTDRLFFYPENGMLDSNTYVIRGETTVLIDPGSHQYLPTLLQGLGEDGIKPDDIKIITNTHLHIDHYWANEAFKKISGAKIMTHPLQKKFYGATVFDTSSFFGLEPVELKEDGCLEDGRLDLGDGELELIPSPGHSPDSICFYSREGRFLISGDVIFAGNTGRVDLPGGSADQLKESIERLAQLEIEFLLPGHMNVVRGAQMVKKNFEFVRKNVFPCL